MSKITLIDAFANANKPLTLDSLAGAVAGAVRASSKRASVPNGVVLYRGPSMLDGAPIVAIATGLAKGSKNAKTGHMVQTYILREDISPAAAVQSGADASICGDCRHRGTVEGGKNVNRSCYVTVIHGPRNVWSSYHRGSVYADGMDLAGIEQACAGKIVRLGTYGDPAAVPMRIWEAVTAQATAATGYTHQWRRFPELAGLCMASCDSEGDRVAARFLGFRSFRVRRATEPKLPGEMNCPASAEMGYRTNCNTCRACGGLAAKIQKDVVIIAHGTPGRNFEKLAA